ncbi:type 2 lantibiotic biosynthesis protein LanM [Lachnotalea glycerini]|uniref:Type 2 lantibiotic biosynthesis protein LanM n=1 Tax=Lachnotalea glycerini TaxID=1763509 RepID=A0A318ETV2_9FIRM|nr:type 2 lanthipeptide synthetase LanM [Lachnotalea glycerini]PXV91688.1 type 2 lantibiotic biosynthesis protein LanM [Lachnotalea glycerini]
MNSIIKKARTIQENFRNYSEDKKVDYSFFNEWRDVRTLLSDKYFDEMLKVNDITKDEFAYSLQPSDDIAINEDGWYNDFSKIMEQFDYSNIDYSLGVNLASFPFSKYFSIEIDKIVERTKNLKISKNVIDSFIAAHAIEMFNIVGKLVALKLAIYKNSHTFESDNQEERFIEFLKRAFCSKQSFYIFYEEYPVAARVATVRTKYLIKNYTDILEHLDKDYEDIKKFLNKESLELTDIKLSTGDSHEQGNSVSILNFEEKKLVYKPKDLRVCTAFEKFIIWYASSSDLLELKIPKGIYKDKYCYNEFIEAEYCINEEQVEKFYIRYGYLIAICYLLNINDLHLENVVACGEYPVIIDMETLFQSVAELKDESIYFELINYLEVTSVANSLLLPKQVHIGIDGTVDLSALNGRETETNQKILMPKMINTDDFHYENVKSMFVGGNNIPKFNEIEEVDVSKYNMLIYDGFNDFIHFIMKNKSECIRTLDSFKGKKIRCLTKSTEKYASMIRFANHPNYNSEMKYRERLLMNVWAYPYQDKRIVKSEVRDMLYNDIPIFFTYVDSKDLVDSHGEIYTDFHNKSGYELAVNKINELSEKEIIRQQCILLLALGIFNPYMNQKVMKRDINYNIRKVDCLKQAKKISDELMKEAYEREDGCSFINIDCNDKKEWKLVPLDEALYGGLSGIAIFFLEMYIRTKENAYLVNYKKIIKTAIEQTKNTIFESAFTGWLSPMYPLILEYKYLGQICDTEYLDFTAKKLKGLKVEDIRNLKQSDYVSGISGTIRLLALLNETFGDKYVTQNTIKNFGVVLKERLEDKNEVSIAKSGIAHGICGLMYGLISAGLIEPIKVKDMLSKEVQIEILEKDGYKWCWGLPGMIQARLAILKINSDCIDINQLNELILRFEGGLTNLINNDTLCHGNGSIIITLKMIYDYTQENKWLSLMQLWISNVNISSLFDGYKVPKVADVSAKGIFDGYFGIGWMYLYASGSINNLLLLETK